MSIGEFLSNVTHEIVIPVHKKRINVIKLTIGQSVYFQTFQKFMRKLFRINFMNISIANCFLANVDFVRYIVLNTVFLLGQRNLKNQQIKVTNLELF